MSPRNAKKPIMQLILKSCYKYKPRRAMGCLFMAILSIVVIVSHSGPKLLLGLNFSVWMCLLLKQRQKQSRKCGPSDVCVESQKQNRNIQMFTLYVFVVYNSLIVNCVRVKW